MKTTFRFHIDVVLPKISIKSFNKFSLKPKDTGLTENKVIVFFFSLKKQLQQQTIVGAHCKKRASETNKQHVSVDKL